MELDQQIIYAIREGKNQLVLNSLYKRTLPKIKNLIRKMNGSEQDALDIFQEAVIVFYREVKLNRMREDTNIDGFIYTVSRNLYLNKLRMSNRHDSFEYSEAAIYAESPSVEKHLEMKDSENEIMTMLGNLGDKCKELLMALVFDDLDYQEVALKLGFASGDVVKTQKHRCKKKLEKMMEEHPLLYKKLAKVAI